MNKNKLIFFLFIFYSFNIVHAAEKIAYIDIDFLLNQSIAGKSITKKLETQNRKDIEQFKITEKKLMDEEKKLISQKNVLSQDDFKKKINELKNKVKLFNERRSNSLKLLNEIKNKSTSILLKTINLLIQNYAKENTIDIILSKSAILIAKSELEITDQILELLNEKIKEIIIE
jgi:outer membrane protein